MVNHWIKKRNKYKKLEEARQALQKWCNKVAYDDFGMYRNGFVMKEKSREVRREFFEEHPAYQEFEMDLRITWNMHHEGGHPTRASRNIVSDPPPTWPNDATGIPEVTIYPENHWKECAEIAKRAKPNYYDHTEEITYVNGTYQGWKGDKIAYAITERTYQIYRRANRLSEDVDVRQHMRDRMNKFWDDIVVIAGRDN